MGDDVRRLTAPASRGERKAKRLRRACAEAYHVVGTLAVLAGVFDDPQVQTALDILSDEGAGKPRRRGVKSMLPFTFTEQLARLAKPRAKASAPTTSTNSGRTAKK